MKLINQSAEILHQAPGLDGVYKQIELAGRTCYKSLDKITETSAKDFVDRMIKSNHLAMLEHGTVYLWNPVDDGNFIVTRAKYSANKYSKVRADGQAITSNLRVLVENNWLDDLKYLCEPTEFHEKRITFRLTTSRHIAVQALRHRNMSFAMESQRYCNYNKEKHGGEITFIKPSWFKEHQLSLSANVAQNSDQNGAVFYERPYKAYWMDMDADGYDWYKEDFFIHSCQTAEKCYLLLLEEGATPQQARVVLPNATKTELIMTGFESDWKHFFDLRYFETTGKVDPDMKDLSTKMFALYSDTSSNC